MAGRSPSPSRPSMGRDRGFLADCTSDGRRPRLVSSPRRKPARARNPPRRSIEFGCKPIERLAPFLPGASPHPWDGYVTGPENELAMARAQAMARGDHQGITPLVVHGASGVGKSRLLAGLVAERLRREPGSAVAHLNAESLPRRAWRRSRRVRELRTRAGDGWPALRDRLRGVRPLRTRGPGRLEAPSAG